MHQAVPQSYRTIIRIFSLSCPSLPYHEGNQEPQNASRPSRKTQKPPRQRRILSSMRRFRNRRPHPCMPRPSRQQKMTA
jgi:hypothetical protein